MTQTERILILDDDPNLRKTLTDILQHKGYRPLPVQNSREALSAISQGDVAVALIDLRLEDRPGLEVLRLIKEHSPYTECIILTGYASQEAAIEAVNAGAFSFLQKPYQIQQLLVTLQRALEKRATARALAESEARYRTFLDAMQDLAFLKDENFRYLFCNQANAKFFGRPLEEIIGRDDFALMDAQAAEGCRRSDRRVLEENRPITTVEIVGERVYETYKFPVPLGNGRTGVGGYVRDMTERLQTEHQMRLQSAALEASANAIVITNREGIIQWANPAFTALTGYKVPDEAFGRNPRDLVKSGKQDQRFYKNLWDTILSGRVWHGTLINRRKDGTLYDEEMTITPVKDASGQITHFIAVKQDISERKQAERALLESERRYAALVEAAPAGIFRTDARGLTTYVSPRWCELSGLDAQAALGNGWLQAIHPDDRERVMEGWLKAYQAGLPSTAEYRFRLPDGTIRWVRGQATPETDSEGRLTGYVGVILDITNLKQAEEALRASEARYRGLFENSPVSLWEEDFSEVKKRLDALRQEGIQDFATYLDAHPDFVRECAALARIRDVNRATLRLYCAANKQDLIANLATVFGEESYQDYRTELLYIAEGKTHFVWEGVNYTLDGQRLDVILHWEVIPGYEHDLSRVLVSIIDVTERKRAEAEIRHYLADLEMLYQSSINFNRLLDPREIGQTLVEILASHLEWHHITIRLRQEQSERLELIAFKYKDKELTQKEQVAAHLSRQISTIDQGLSGKAVREGKSILATDVHRFPEYLETFPSIRSGLYVPLIIEGRVIGVISIESEQADAFSQEDVRLLETLAAHAASAFHSAHLYQATLRAAQRREVLYRLSQEITQNFGNRDRVYEAIYQAVRQIMPADNFTIAIHDEATGEFIGEYLIDEGKRWPPVRASIQEGISGYVIRSGRPLRIGDALQESNAPTPIHYGSDRPSRAYLCVPLRIGERIIGAMSAQSYQPHVYTQEDETLLEMLAAYAAPTIENTRLYEETKRRLQELTIIHEFSQQILRLQTSEELGESILHLLKSLLHYEQSAILLLDKTTQTLLPFAIGAGEENAEWVRDLRDRVTQRAIRLGEGITGWVALHGKSARVDDVRQDGRYIAMRENMRSELCVPLKSGDEVLGVINIESPFQAAYDDHDQRILETIAAEVSIAIQNAHLLEETRQRLYELEEIVALSSELRTTGEASKIIPILTRHAIRAVGADAGSFYLCDQINHRWILKGWQMKDGIWQQPAFPVWHLEGEGVTGLVGNRNRLYITGDWRTDPITKLLAGAEEWLQEFTSCISLPVSSDQHVLGVLHLWHKDFHAFTESEKRLATAIADIGGNALQRALLFEETRRRVEQLQALQIINQAILSSVDLRLFYHILIEQSRMQLGAEAISLSIYQAQSHTLECVASDGFKSSTPAKLTRRLGEDIAGQTALSRRTITIPDIRTSDTPWLHRSWWEEEGLVACCATPLVSRGHLKGVLQVFRREPFTPESEWIHFFETLARQAAIAIDNTHMFNELQQKNLELALAYDATIEGLSRALDLRDQETEGHTRRVADLSVELARALGMSEDEILHLRRGALLHDIGKIGIPDSILFKAGPLTKKEWEIMRKHPQSAYEMLAPIEYLQPALDIPHYHHERWDGSGYPEGRKGEEIPLAARIFAVVDVWDALTSNRPYRKAWSREKALEYIAQQSGKAFDPKVVEAFIQIMKHKSRLS